MIPKIYFTITLVFVTILMHTSSTQDTDNYEASDWIPIDNPKRVRQADDGQEKRASARVLHVAEPPQGNFFPDDLNGRRKTNSRQNHYSQYLIETTNQPPVRQQQKKIKIVEPYKYESIESYAKPAEVPERQPQVYAVEDVRPTNLPSQKQYVIQDAPPLISAEQLKQAQREAQEYLSSPEVINAQILQSSARPNILQPQNEYYQPQRQQIQYYQPEPPTAPEQIKIPVNTTLLHPGIDSINQALNEAAHQRHKLPTYPNIHVASTVRPQPENVQLVYVPLETLQQNQHRQEKSHLRDYQTPRFEATTLTPILIKTTTYRPPQIKNIEQDFIKQALEAHRLQTQLNDYLSSTTSTTTTSTTARPQTTTTKKRKAHQPPLAVFMSADEEVEVTDVLNLLKDAKSIHVQDTIAKNSPPIFIGPSNLKAPNGFAKFELPYLSTIDSNRVERKVEQLPFFVAPLSYKAPSGYSKIALPSPHVGSVVVSTKHLRDEQEKRQKLLEEEELRRQKDLKEQQEREYLERKLAEQQRERQKQQQEQRLREQYQTIAPQKLYLSTTEIPLLEPGNADDDANAYRKRKQTARGPQVQRQRQRQRPQIKQEEQEEPTRQPAQNEYVQISPDQYEGVPQRQYVYPENAYISQTQRPQHVQTVQYRPSAPENVYKQHEEFDIDSYIFQQPQQVQRQPERPHHPTESHSIPRQQPRPQTQTQPQSQHQSRPQQVHYQFENTNPQYTSQKPSVDFTSFLNLEAPTSRKPETRPQTINNYELEQINNEFYNTPTRGQQIKFVDEDEYEPIVSSRPPKPSYVSTTPSYASTSTNRVQERHRPRSKETYSPSSTSSPADYSVYRVNTNPITELAEHHRPVTQQAIYSTSESSASNKPQVFANEGAHLNNQHFVQTVTYKAQPAEVEAPRTRAPEILEQKIAGFTSQHRERPEKIQTQKRPTYDESPVKHRPDDDSREQSSHEDSSEEITSHNSLNANHFLPNLINNLQDQAIRPLLIPALIAPTTPAPQTHTQKSRGNYGSTSPRTQQYIPQQQHEEKTRVEQQQQTPLPTVQYEPENAQVHQYQIVKAARPEEQYLNAYKQLQYEEFISSPRPVEIKQSTLTPSVSSEDEYIPTSTPIPSSTTTRRSKGRQRGGSRFSTATVTSAPRRNPQTRTRRPTSRTKYNPEVAAASTTDYSANKVYRVQDYSTTPSSVRTSPSKQRFRTRGRPTTERATDVEPVRKLEVPSKTLQFQDGFQASTQIPPSREYLEYDKSKLIAVPQLEVPHEPQQINVQITNPSTPLVKQPNNVQYLQYTPSHEPVQVVHAQTTAQVPSTTARSRGRSRSKIRNTTPRPTSTTTTKKPAVKANSEEEFYGFFRAPNFNQPSAIAAQQTARLENYDRQPLYSVQSSSTPAPGFRQEPEEEPYESDSPSSTTTVRFVGELRPKYQATTEQYLREISSPVTQTVEIYTVRQPIASSTEVPKSRGRVRTRAPTKKKTPEYNRQYSSAEDYTTRRTAQRGRTRGKVQFTTPNQLRNKDDEDVEGGNYPENFLRSQTQSTARPVFQITIDPHSAELTDDQEPYSSILRPKVLKTVGTQWTEVPNNFKLVNDIPLEIKTVSSVEEEKFVEAGTAEGQRDVITVSDIGKSELIASLPLVAAQDAAISQPERSVDVDESTTKKLKGRRRGVWRRKKKPVDVLEEAESQNYPAHNVNTFLEENSFKKNVYKTSEIVESKTRTTTVLPESIQTTISTSNTAQPTTTTTTPNETTEEPTTNPPTTQKNFFDTLYEMFGMAEFKQMSEESSQTVKKNLKTDEVTTIPTTAQVPDDTEITTMPFDNTQATSTEIPVFPEEYKEPEATTIPSYSEQSYIKEFKSSKTENSEVINTETEFVDDDDEGFLDIDDVNDEQRDDELLEKEETNKEETISTNETGDKIVDGTNTTPKTPSTVSFVKTSTSTEITHETEICYKGRCVKTTERKSDAN